MFQSLKQLRDADIYSDDTRRHGTPLVGERCRFRSRQGTHPRRLLRIWAKAVKRTFVYVDGFNLYYRALKGTPHKWLDILALVRNLLDADNDIQKIRYFTAPVSGKLDPGQPVRQDTYLRALRTLPCVEVHFGNFLTKQKVRPLGSVDSWDSRRG